MRVIQYILLISIVGCAYDKKPAAKYIDTDSISMATLKLSDSLAASRNAFDSLKPIVQQTVAQLKYYEQLKTEIEYKEAEIIYRPTADSSAIIALRAKLNEANNEIYRLKGELVSIERKRNITPIRETYIQPAIITPDDNSVIITLDGSSPKGDIPVSSNLAVYLLPYKGKVRKYMKYEAYCDESLSGNLAANYYNGLYFFNNVQPGKYLIKICTYYGNFKLIEKPSGKYNVKMQIAPPIQ